MGLLSYLLFFATMALIFGIATLGLNLQWGFTGLFNAGVVGFYAIGAYTLAILTAPPRPELLGNFDLPWIIGLAGAMLTSAIAAYVIGIATINLRGDYLAISTFGIGMAIQLVTLNWEALTGGSQGFANVGQPLRNLFSGSFAYNVFYAGLVIAIAMLVYWALQRIVRSPWGRVLKSIREDENAAVALGKDVAAFRLQAFVLGALIMGLAGALHVTFVGFVSPFDFMPIVTFQMWTMLIVGGSGNNRGAILGAFIVWGLWTGSGTLIVKIIPPSLQAQAGALQTVLIGLVLVLMLLFRPRGLIGEAAVVSRHVD